MILQAGVLFLFCSRPTMKRTVGVSWPPRSSIKGRVFWGDGGTWNGGSPTWRMGSQDLDTGLGAPPFISHNLGHFWFGSHNPILRGRNRSPELETTYPGPGMILQVLFLPSTLLCNSKVRPLSWICFCTMVKHHETRHHFCIHPKFNMVHLKMMISKRMFFSQGLIFRFPC